MRGVPCQLRAFECTAQPSDAIASQAIAMREVKSECRKDIHDIEKKPMTTRRKLSSATLGVLLIFERPWLLARRQRPPPQMLPQKVQRRHQKYRKSHPSPSPKHLLLWLTICFPMAYQITSPTALVGDTSTTHGPHVPIAVRYHRMPPEIPSRLCDHL